MKKIMFNDKYGLTDAVVSGRKTMTRRLVPFGLYNQTDWKAVAEGDYEAVVDGDGYYHDIRKCGAYHVGEMVAIAQKYWDLRNNEKFYEALEKADPYFPLECIKDEKGCHNKMFVKAEWMPHAIRITDIKVERLQDISDEDIMREGIMEGEFMNTWDRFYYDHWGDVANHITFRTPREAFASLIDCISGKGTWERNPWVYAYSFELIKQRRIVMEDFSKNADSIFDNLKAKQGELKSVDGTFVNVDDVREDFVQEVYRVLDADSTNDRANQIIDAFDNLPTVTIEKQGEQQPAGWSEEDELMLNSIISTLKLTNGAAQMKIDWLKGLRPQKPNPRFPQYKNIVDKVFGAGNLESWEREEAEQLVLLAKEEVEKSLSPQNRWKPSEEQMKALKEACDEHWEPDGLDPLYILWEQLKKLREE